MERMDSKGEERISSVDGASATNVTREEAFIVSESVEEGYPMVNNLGADIPPKPFNALVSNGRTDERSWRSRRWT